MIYRILSINADNKTWQAVNKLKAEDYTTLPCEIPFSITGNLLLAWEGCLSRRKLLNKAFFTNWLILQYFKPVGDVSSIYSRVFLG